MLQTLPIGLVTSCSNAIDQKLEVKTNEGFWYFWK